MSATGEAILDEICGFTWKGARDASRSATAASSQTYSSILDDVASVAEDATLAELRCLVLILKRAMLLRR